MFNQVKTIAVRCFFSIGMHLSIFFRFCHG